MSLQTNIQSASEPVLEILENLVPPHLRADAWAACLSHNWYFGNRSVEEHANQFWKMDLDRVPAIDSIWEHVKARCEQVAGAPLRVIRQYANGHTYGLGGQTHVDDTRPGTYTLLYYPMPEWPVHWEGETVFLDQQSEIAVSVRPLPNRAVLFDARIPHAGRAPSRACPGLRVTVAFKLETVAAGEQIPAQDQSTTPSVSVRETGREGPVRRFEVSIPEDLVRGQVTERLHTLERSVRLPGFRTGNIPMEVLEQRYGVRARSEVVARLSTDTSAWELPPGGIILGAKIVEGASAGNVVVHAAAMYPQDLTELDFANFTLERLVPEEDTLENRAAASLHLKQQILDRLSDAYAFPVATGPVERELAAIHSAMAAHLAGTDPAERDDLLAQLQDVAERRVRLGIIIAEFARRHQLRITEHEVNKAAGTEETSSQTATRLMEAKVIAWIASKAKVHSRSVTSSELRQLLDGIG